MYALVAIGSNVNPVTNVQRALKALAQCDWLASCQSSSLYRSVALDDGGRPLPGHTYVNAAALFESELAPADIKRALRALEDRLGRLRTSTDGGIPAIAIDLDLVMIADATGKSLTSASPELRLPHPDLLQRAYVAIPAAELAPNWRHPVNHSTLRAIAAQMSHTELEKIEL